MGRSAQGVRAMRLKKGDELVCADIISAKEKPARPAGGDALILVVSENGFGKKTKISEYRLQKRGGSGIKTSKVTPKTGNLVSAKVLSPDLEEIIAISKKGQVIRTSLKEISELGRATQGVRIMRLDSKDKLASITCLFRRGGRFLYDSFCEKGWSYGKGICPGYKKRGSRTHSIQI